MKDTSVWVMLANDKDLGVVIFLANKWILNKVIDISRLSDKVLVQGIIVSVNSDFTQHCGLSVTQKW